MHFRIFSLFPDLFTSFWQQSLIARGLAKNLFSFQIVNWREKYSLNSHGQVDDKPFGGGSGMVLMAEPIVTALEKEGRLSEYVLAKNSWYTVTKVKTETNADKKPEATLDLPEQLESKSDSKDLAIKDLTIDSTQTTYSTKTEQNNFTVNQKESSLNSKDTTFNTKKIHQSYLPPNADFYSFWLRQKSQGKTVSVCTIQLTPRGFPLSQTVCQWLAENFQELNILCGRYEGFDERVREYVDLELSIGNFVTNGGEIPAMALIEAVTRLLPGFITKETSVWHDSFSSHLNFYPEHSEFVIGKRKWSSLGNQVKELHLTRKQAEELTKLTKVLTKAKETYQTETWQVGENKENSKVNLFDNDWYLNTILPQIEHPQYTRPQIWRGWQVPEVLLSGDHKKIQAWRQKWY